MHKTKALQRALRLQQVTTSKWFWRARVCLRAQTNTLRQNVVAGLRKIEKIGTRDDCFLSVAYEINLDESLHPTLFGGDRVHTRRRSTVS